MLLLLISNTFLHLEKRKIIFCAAYFLHFSFVLKNNGIAFSLLRLIWPSDFTVIIQKSSYVRDVKTGKSGGCGGSRNLLF